MQIDAAIQALAAEIAERWRDVPYPGDRAVSAGWDHEEELAREMTGRSWEQLATEFLQQFSRDDGIDRLRPQAFHYYLPAFLTLALTDSSTQDAVARLLTPPGRHRRDAWSLERFWEHVDLLNGAQKRVIGKLFMYWRDRDWLTKEEWNDALEYWQPYISGE